MTPPLILMTCALAATAVSWFYGVWEYRSAMKLRPKVYRRGIRIVGLVRPAVASLRLPEPVVATDRVGNTSDAARTFRIVPTVGAPVLEELVGADQVSGQLLLSPGQGALRAALYREGHVDEESCRDDGSLELHVTLSRKRYEQLMKEFDALKSLQRESSGACRVTASGS